MEPLVSIICPTHNAQRYISETMSCLLNQTYVNIEIIFIDDFSNDNTINIISSIRDKRIKLIKNKCNKGAAYSRNIGIKFSRGEYLAFIDADDLWELDKLEKQIAFMSKNNYCFSCSYYQIIDSNSKPLNRYIKSPKKISFSKLVRTNFIGTSTVIYKKDIFPNLSAPESLKKRNDIALWLQISKVEACHCLPEILVKYRKTPHSLSSSSKVSLFLWHIKLYKLVLKYCGLRSVYCALRNVLYFFVRKIFYCKKVK